MTAAVAPGDRRTPTTPSLARLARLGVELRWRLVTNRAKRAGAKTRRFAYVLSALYALGNIVALASTRWASDSVAEGRILLVASSLASGWIFGPILVGGVDETVDPTRLALLPLRARELFCVQLAAAVSGAGPLGATASLTLGTTIGFAPMAPGAVLIPIAALTTIVIVVGVARAVAAVLAIAQRSRLGRDLSVILAALIGGAMFIVAQLAATSSGEDTDQLFDVLARAPWAWPIRSIIAVRAGHEVSALAWLAAGFVAAAMALWVWSSLSQFLLHNGERVVRTGRRSRGKVLNGAGGVFTGALARQWIYLRRAPKARVSLAFGVAFGVAFPVLQLVQHGGGDTQLAPFSVLLAMFTNVGATGNIIGFDAASLWMEVLAGGPRRAHMAARSLMTLPNLLLPTWIAGIVVGLWTGQWRMVILICLIAVPIALLAVAQGLITSVLGAWPLSDGDNPFGNRQGAEGRGGKLAIIALSGLFSATMLALPILIALWTLRSGAWAWLVPFAGMAYAVAGYLAALGWVDRRLLGNEPELVERLSPVAVNG